MSNAASPKLRPVLKAPAGTLTGAKVLVWLLGFFGAMVIANSFLVYFALSTFSGLDSQNSYETGLAFQRGIIKASAQNALGWKVDVAVTPAAGGMTTFSFAVHDKEGQAVDGLKPVITLNHAATSRLDQAVAVTETGNGTYAGATRAIAGQWYLVIAFERGGERLFLSRNRLALKGGADG